MKLGQALTAVLLAGALFPAQAGFVIGFEDATNGPNPFSEWSNVGETYKGQHNTVFKGEIKSLLTVDHCALPGEPVGSCGANVSGGEGLNRSPKGVAAFYGSAVDGDAFGRGEFTINVLDGFEDMFSLLWGATASASDESRLDIYDQLNGEGSLLGSLLLGPQSPANGGLVTSWSGKELSFAGTAYSIVFRITPRQIFLDDLSFGSRDDNNTVPEPASLALGLTALAALGLSRRRKA